MCVRKSESEAVVADVVLDGFFGIASGVLALIHDGLSAAVVSFDLVGVGFVGFPNCIVIHLMFPLFHRLVCCSLDHGLMIPLVKSVKWDFAKICEK